LGNTQYIAMLINEKVGGEIYRIEPKIPYTTDHKKLIEQATEEQNNNARPEINYKISNFDDYDVIYIGYPIWRSDMPQILYTFLELYDFKGKTVIPFSTHGGSGLAGTVNTIKNKLTEATVVENAFTMSRNDIEKAPEEVEEWLRKINLTETGLIIAKQGSFSAGGKVLTNE
jgi:flavodoxin